MRGLFVRLVRVVTVAMLVPLVIGLLTSVLGHLDRLTLSGRTFRVWVEWGFVTYVGLHVLLYRPAGLFHFSHRVFSAVAVWLFGGQVASVEKSGNGKGAKGAQEDVASQGSTLVAFSPYVIPVYTVLVCVAAWGLSHWLDRALLDGPVSFFIGVTAAFHWLMTADDLQQQRKRWHVETYLLAIGLVFLMTLLIGAACLPLAVPGFSFAGALSEGLANTRAIFTTAVHQLFL